MKKQTTLLSLAVVLFATQGCCFKPCAYKCKPAPVAAPTQPVCTNVVRADKETYVPTYTVVQQAAPVAQSTQVQELVNLPIEEVNLDEIIVDEMDMLPAFQAEQA